jgi:hypothetical protein
MSCSDHTPELPPEITHAVTCAHVRRIESWLNTAPAHAQQQEALVLASCLGQAAIVNALLVHQPQQSRLRSLYDAAYGNHHETLDRLRQGAEPADWRATQRAYLGEAARWDRIPLVEVLLIDLSCMEDASAALFEASRHGHVRLTARLLHWALSRNCLPGLLVALRGRDVVFQLQESQLRTTLDEAVRVMVPEIPDTAATVLLEQGPRVGFDTSAVVAYQLKKILELRPAAPAPLRSRL